MKTLVLLLILLCPVCHGVQISPDGRGDVLLFPFVTGRTPHDSLISVTNPDMSSLAAVRITFRGRGGSDYSLNTYLRPGATWVGALTADGLLTDSRRCALGPGMTGLAQPISQVEREGYLEIYELGRLNAGHPVITESDDACEQINWDGLDWQPPRSSVTGQVHLVDTAGGVGFTFAPLVLDQFSAMPLHGEPDPAFPLLTDANPLRATLNSGSERVTTTWDNPLAMISAVLAVYQAESDFSIEPSIGARHEVVIAFPTLDAVGSFAPFYPALLFSGRARSGFVSREGQIGQKCTPSFRAPPPYADQRLVRVRLGEQAVFAGDTAPAQNVSPVGNGCGYSTQQPFSGLFESGRLLIQPLEQSYRSLEGVVVRGLPMVAASVTLLANEDLLGVRANYALVNTLDRRLNIDPPPQRLVPVACREYAGEMVALSADGRFTVIDQQPWQPDTGLMVVDEMLNDVVTFDESTHNSQIVSAGGVRLVVGAEGQIFELDLLDPQSGFVLATDLPEEFSLSSYGTVSDEGRYFFSDRFEDVVQRFDRVNQQTQQLPIAARTTGRIAASSGDGQWIVTTSFDPLTLRRVHFESGEVTDLLADLRATTHWSEYAYLTLLDADAELNQLVFEVRDLNRRMVFQLDLTEQRLTNLNPQNVAIAFADEIQQRDSRASISQAGTGLFKTSVQLGTGSARSPSERLWKLTGKNPAAERLDLRLADGDAPRMVNGFMVSEDGSTILATLKKLGDQPGQLCRYLTSFAR